MNYHALYNLAVDYTSRDDLGTETFDEWLRAVEMDINARLVNYQTEGFAKAAVSEGRAELPGDCAAVEGVVVGTRALTYAAPGRFWKERSNPGLYTVSGRTVVIGGAPDGVEAAVRYRRGVAPLSEGSPTNQVLEDFPNVYKWGVLREAYGWIADAAMAGAYDRRLDDALAEANLISADKAFPELVMRPDNGL